MKWLPLLFALFLLAGCSTFDSRIHTNPKTGDIELRLPKDASWDSLHYRREFRDVLGNPVVTDLSIANGNFKMNPQVIDSKTRRDVELIKAGAAAGAQVIGAIPK